MQEPITENSCESSTKDRISAPYFNKSIEDKEMRSFAKSKAKIKENIQEISFQAHTEEDEGFLYEEQPSNFYENYPTEEATSLTHEALQFM